MRGAGAAGGGTAAARVGLRGGSVRSPEAAPAGPARPRPGFQANRYSASAGRASSARTGRGAGPTRGPPAVPLPKPSLPRPRLLKGAPPHNLGVPLSLLKAATKAPGAVARQAPPGKEAQAVLHLRIPGGGGERAWP